MPASLWSLEPISGELESSSGCFNFGVFDDDGGAGEGVVILIMIISRPSKDPKNEKEKRKLTKGGNQDLYQSVKGAKVGIKLSPPVTLTILIRKKVFTLLPSGKKCAMMLQERKPTMNLK